MRLFRTLVRVTELVFSPCSHLSCQYPLPLDTSSSLLAHPMLLVTPAVCASRHVSFPNICMFDLETFVRACVTTLHDCRATVRRAGQRERGRGGQ